MVTLLLRKATLVPEILKNYCPVNNLSFVSKVLEGVVAQRLTSYMTDNNLPEYLQSAYTPGHSTETALVKVQNDILTSIDQHGIVILILLDLSAAFNTIHHDVLFSRMESTLGIIGPALEWFRSYLGDHTLRVQIDDSFSASQGILWSVPQGSVLGPLLLTIYLLLLEILIRKHGLEVGLAKLENCLTNIYTWIAQNKLKLNADKIDVLAMGTPQMLPKISIPSFIVNGVKVPW